MVDERLKFSLLLISDFITQIQSDLCPLHIPITFNSITGKKSTPYILMVIESDPL